MSDVEVLWWWALPATATLLAVCWAGWVRRSPRDLGDADTVAAYAAFRVTLARSAAAPAGQAHADGGARNTAVPPVV